jgi:hypothetical protein
MSLVNYNPARDSDPETSQAAARRLTGRYGLQRKVLHVFAVAGFKGATNEDVYAAYPDIREDVLRPRVAELRTSGLIEEWAKRMGSRKRDIMVWRITDRGRAYVRGLYIDKLSTRG